MQVLWGLWLCQFCSKVSFVSAFQDHFDPVCMPSACPEVFYGFFWNCTTGRWMWPRQRCSWHCNSWVSAWLLPSLRQLGTSRLFLCLLLVVPVGMSPAVRPGWAVSAKVLRTRGDLRMERARSRVQEQSKVPFSASQISQDSFPLLGCPSLVRVSAVREVLLGEVLPWGCPIFPCCRKSKWSFRWGGSVVGCKQAAVLLYC